MIAGDGGFQMTAAELSTIVQEKIKINIAIINNGYLGMVRQWQEFFYESNYEATPLLSARLRQAGRCTRHRRRAVSTVRKADAETKARSPPAPYLLNFHGRKGRLGLSDDSRRKALHEMIRRPGKIRW